jgi:major intracellular serine protease
LSGCVIGGTNDYTDQNGHGTHVSGIILGVAPEAKILAMKIDAVGGLAQAINFATEWCGNNGEKVSVMNISQSVQMDNIGLNMAVKNAVDAGIVIVAAAGNYGDGNISTNECIYPGAYPEVVEVGAIDQNGQLAEFTDTNPEIDFVAPGVDVKSTMVFGNYSTLSGTSQATPHTAGVFALVRDYIEKQVGHELSVAELRDYMRQFSKDIGLPWPTLDLSNPISFSKGDDDEVAKLTNFSDVEEGRWSEKYIADCVQAGIISGFEDGTFRPTDTLTREQICTIISKLMTRNQ